MQRCLIRRKRAFTLIEILLVAGILALLAAFALPQLFGTAQQARVKLASAAIERNGSIGRALETYNFDMGGYPESDEGLRALFEKPRDDNEGRWKGPYMNVAFEKLKDPWGNDYRYKAPGNVNSESYDLWSPGPDGKDDNGRAGSDDIKNWSDK